MGSTSQSSSMEHTCRSIMTLRPVTLQRADSVTKAVKLFLDHRMLGIPVIDPDSRYVGMFVRSTLIALLLPRVVSSEKLTPKIGHLIGVSFVSDTLEEVRERFARVADDPIERHVSTDTPILRPDTPVTTALFLLYRTRNFLPVVEESTEKLVGVVSTWDVLAKVSR
jgi:CBS-domain-containing membrane protein